MEMIRVAEGGVPFMAEWRASFGQATANPIVLTCEASLPSFLCTLGLHVCFITFRC